MRPFAVSLILMIPSVVSAAEIEAALRSPQLLNIAPDYQLGGAVTRSALVPEADTPDETVTRPRLSLPITPPDTAFTQREASLGGATLFLGEGLDSGRDALQMGTFLRRGAARAGVSVTYLEREAEVSRSEVFLDYSVTEQFSVGLSGILNSEISDDDPVPQLGLSAEYSTDGGAYLQGGVADAAEYDPVIGVSIGLRF